jgi:hypothetical protein
VNEPEFHAWKDHVLDSVRSIANNMPDRPDSDFAPVLLLVGKHGFRVKCLHGVIDTPEQKDRFLDWLTQQLAKNQAEYAATVISCWQRVLDIDNPLDEVAFGLSCEFGVRNDPKRTEIVMVEVASRDGQDVTLSANITRSPDRQPTIDDFQDFGTKLGDDAKGIGRMANVLSRAFRKAFPKAPA